MKPEDWVVLVTGGASGLGKATVERLAKEGAKVCILDLPQPTGVSFAKEVTEENSLLVEADVRSEAQVKTAFEKCKKKFGQVNGLVNCAGIINLESTYDQNLQKEHSLEIFKRVLDVNCTGTFNACRIAAATMKDNAPNEDGQRGVVVNTSSIIGFDGLANSVAYAASKAAIIGMTLPMARDLAPLGVRVMTIAPGACSTPLYEAAPQQARAACEATELFPRRLVKPDEFARLVMAILANPMLNGETIRLDGGMRLHVSLLAE